MADFRLFNTLTRQVEPFAPADRSSVRIYACGPTVYDPAHLGNFRTFLFVDLLQRVLRLRGWDVELVMNITDVDDKIIRRAAERGQTITDVTAPITDVFHRDREFLHIQAASRYPKATEHIPEMIALVQRLLDRELAYLADDGSIYFAIDRFPEYGKLSRLDRRQIKVGARVAQDDYAKENAQDFALWKAAKPEDERTGAAWDSPWGRGRPGWHLECSAMAMRYLGETLDIHTGAVDLIFPHHEDEIAQSEGATGRPFSRFWCHGEFLLTEGAKMAKRVGNVANVDYLREQGIPGAAMRYLVYSTEYRKQLNLTDEALEAAQGAVRRVSELAKRLESATGGSPALAQAADDAEVIARERLFDDLDAPRAMAALFTFINRANAELDRGGSNVAALVHAREVFARLNGVFDLVPERRAEDPAFVAWVEERLSARQSARSRRDFPAADAIRQELEGRGIVIEDLPSGPRWKRAS